MILLATFVTLSTFASVDACNVPVFRFALERWRPDPYRVTVFHRGALSDADRELLAPLEEQQDKSQANLAVRTLDVSEIDDTDQHLLAARDNITMPTLVLYYPAPLRIAGPIWIAPLSKENVSSLIDSPIRQELIRRLTDGQTSVWLLLECGQREKDNAAAMLVREQLEQLEQELKLPELTDSSEDKLLAATPLQVAFSLLRVPRGDAEQTLTSMLLKSEPDLLEYSEPMVFPVFGRGRALLPLIGAGITAENIHDSAAFLVGACSCEVKEQNPGFDLLLAADWDALLSQDGVPLLASQTRNVAPPGEAELVPIPSGAAKVTEMHTVRTVHSGRWLVLGLTFAGVAVIVALLARR
jgi:hypothetical protein